MSDFAANAPGLGFLGMFSTLFSGGEDTVSEEARDEDRRELMNDLLSRCPTAVTSEAGMHELMSVYPGEF